MRHFKPSLECLEDRTTPSVSWPTFDTVPASIAPQGRSSGFTGYHLASDPVTVSHQIGLFVSATGLQSVTTDQEQVEPMHWVFTVHNPVQVILGQVSGASVAANPVTGEILVSWVQDGDVRSESSFDGGSSWAAPVLVTHDASLQSTHATWVPESNPLPTASNPMPLPSVTGHFVIPATDLPERPDYASIAQVFRQFHQDGDGWTEG